MHEIPCFRVKLRLRNSIFLVKYQQMQTVWNIQDPIIIQNLSYILILEIEVLNSHLAWPLVCFWFVMKIKLLFLVSVLYVSINVHRVSLNRWFLKSSLASSANFLLKSSFTCSNFNWDKKIHCQRPKVQFMSLTGYLLNICPCCVVRP